MACRDCFTNCGGNITSDRCIKYTGPDIEFLGLETGDTLSMVEAALIENLQIALDGTGITFTDLEACKNVTDALGKSDANLANIIQAINDVICEFQADIDTINEKIKPLPVSFDTKCVPGLASDASRDDILQAVINKLCLLDTSVTEISGDYVKSSELCDKVSDCLTPSSGGSTILQENTKMPKYVALPYHGPMSVFDAAGIGLSSAGYEKVYICNGQTVGTFVTPDYRGRSPLGANTNVPGGTLDTAIDPSLLANAGYGITMGAKKGEYTHTDTINELPVHSINIPASNYTIKIPGQRGGDNSDNNNTTAFAGGDKLPSDTGFNFTLSVPATTPAITSNSVGGGQPHNNTHPVIGTVFIIYIP